MGLMRFVLPGAALADDALPRAYLSGWDGIPWPSTNRVQGDLLTLERRISESGTLHIPWRVEGFGELLLASASLIEREHPYVLPVELARGAVSRLRNQLVEWESSGVEIPDSCRDLIRQASTAFVKAATTQRTPLQSAELAQRCLELALRASDELTSQYARHAMLSRRDQYSRLPTLMAVSLDRRPKEAELERLLLEAFTWAAPSMLWSQIEPDADSRRWEASDLLMQWCEQNQRRVCAGPMLQLTASSIPQWIYLWEDDFEQLRSLMTQHIQSCVRRYAGRVHAWHAAAGVNIGGPLKLTEEQRLKLTLRAVEAIRALDRQTPVIVSFDQPWGEYLANNEMELTPLHFADALARADIGLSGIGLNIHLGYWPGGTLPRDLLDLNRQIEQWSMLNIPLMISLAIPSDPRPEPKGLVPLEHFMPQGPTPQGQDALVCQILPLLVAKPFVHGFLWAQLHDGEGKRLSHAGLVDAQGRAKPLLASLARFRRDNLI